MATESASMNGEEYDPTQQPVIDQQEEEQSEQEEEQDADADAEDDNDDDDDDYDPSSFMPDVPTVDENSSSTVPDLPAVDDSVQPSATPQSALVASSQPPSHVPSRTTSTQPTAAVQTAQKPVAIGGFIEEDDDDDDDDDDEAEEARDAVAQHAATNGNAHLALSQQNTPLPDNTPLVSQSHTPSQLNTQVYNAPKDEATPDMVPNANEPTAESVPTPASQVPPPKSVSAAAAAAETKPATPIPQPSSTSLPASSSVSKPRLPQDQVGKLEDRIADDPKGDVNAWLELIAFYKGKNKLDEARQVYDRFFQVFPTAAEQWVAFANMELENDDFFHLEQIFSKALLKNHNVQLWSIYLDYIRRRNNVMTDTTGQARSIINSGYEFVLNVVGIDKDSGSIWRDYINFIKDGPGNIGGSGWQDAQKMDTVRKAYQRAVTVPHAQVQTLWKEYDSFETSLNKTTGRKTLQEKSPAYMTARGAYTQLQNITRDLNRTTLPILPPAPGFLGDDEYNHQVQIWQNWIQWEKEEDPVALKDEDIKAYRDRIIYAYRQAVMALRFWPQIWYDAAEWCYSEGMDTEGDDFMAQGIVANPESCLLAFKQADRIEQNLGTEEGEDGSKKRGDALRVPYDTCLTALYAMINKIREREPKQIAAIEEYYDSLPPSSRDPTPEAREDDDEEGEPKTQVTAKDIEKNKQVDAIKMGTKAQVQLLSRLLSNVWVALMRAFRRIQGKGKPDGPVLGLRGIFAEARKRGRLTSDVYVAAALLEHHCYKDISATKIFERGIRLFPDDEAFALEYLKHLIAINDITNARAVFETTVSKLTSKPDTIPKSKPLYLYMADHESHYGDLPQITKLEKRMHDLFPEDPSLSRFAHRFKTGSGISSFDPCLIRPVISPSSQMKPKLLVPPGPPPVQQSVEHVPTNTQNILSNTGVVAAAQQQYTASPKRPFDADLSEQEGPVRKIPRGESPLKGAAGRRQQQRQRAVEGYGSQNVPPPTSSSSSSLATAVSAPLLAQQHIPAGPKPLPRELVLFLQIIPHASTWPAGMPGFDAQAFVEMIRGVDLGRANVGGNNAGYGQQPAAAYGGIGAGGYGGFGYGR